MSLDPFDEPTDTREEILAATYRALCRHGYADLTVKRIGEEFAKSQSLIYHHYEDKDALVLACLEFMLAQFEAEYVDTSVDDPREALETMLDVVFATDIDEDQRTFHRTLIELRGQMGHDPDFREHFTRSDRVFETYLTDVLEAGVERGHFRPIDPDRIATVLFTAITGAFFRDATTDGDRTWLEAARAELTEYLHARVYANAE